MKRVKTIGCLTLLIVICLLLTGRPVHAAQGTNLYELHFYEGETLSYLLAAGQEADPNYAIGLVKERYVDEKSLDFYGEPFYLQAVYARSPKNILDPAQTYGPSDPRLVTYAYATIHYVLANGYEDYSKEGCNNNKYSGANKHESYYITQIALYLDEQGLLLRNVDTALNLIAPLKQQNPAIYEKIELLARDAYAYACSVFWRDPAKLPFSVTAPHTEDASAWVSEIREGKAGLRSPQFSVNTLAKELDFQSSDPRVKIVRTDVNNPSSDYYLWISEEDYQQMDGAQATITVEGTVPLYYGGYFCFGPDGESLDRKDEMVFCQPEKAEQQTGQLASTRVIFPSAGATVEKYADRTKKTSQGSITGIYEPGETIDYTIRVTCTAESSSLPIRVTEMPDQTLLACAQSYGFLSRCVDADGKAVPFSKVNETEVLLHGMTEGQTAELHFVLQLKKGLTQGAQQLGNKVTAGYDAETYRKDMAADTVKLYIPDIQPEPEIPKTYVTVTFVNADGNVLKVVRVEKGGNVDKEQFPSAPQVNGSTFSCWMTGTTVFTENTKAEENLTVKAVYHTTGTDGTGGNGGEGSGGNAGGAGDGDTGGTGQTGSTEDRPQGEQTDSTGDHTQPDQTDSTQEDQKDSTEKDSAKGDQTDKDSAQGEQTDRTDKDKTDSTVTSSKVPGTLTSGSALDGSSFYSPSSGYTVQGTGTYSTGSGVGTSPKTGDRANLLLWAGIFLLSAGGILLGGKRKRNS